MTRRLRFSLAVLALIIGGALLYQGWQRRSSGLPRQGSQAYEQTTRAFYSGVAALQVGLLDDAVRYFTEATRLAPREPAAWGNLAVARLRLSDVEAAEPAVNEALRLADDAAEVQLLAARWEIARGNLDAGILKLRRAIELDPDNLRAGLTLAEELERAGTPAQATEAMALLDDAVRRAPTNVALLLERARVAAAQQKAASLTDSVSRLQSASTAWSPLARTQLQALQASAGSGDVAQTSRAVLMLRNALARETSFAADLAAVRTPPDIIADAFETFLRLPPPPATPAAPDLSWRFTAEDLDPRPATAAVALTLDATGPPVVFAADAASIWRTGDPNTALLFPGGMPAPVSRLVRMRCSASTGTTTSPRTCWPPAAAASGCSSSPTDGSRIERHRRVRRHPSAACVARPGVPTWKWTATSTSYSASPAVPRRSFATTATGCGRRSMSLRQRLTCGHLRGPIWMRTAILTQCCSRRRRYGSS